MDYTKTTARRDEKQLSLGISVPYIRDLTVYDQCREEHPWIT